MHMNLGPEEAPPPAPGMQMPQTPNPRLCLQMFPSQVGLALSTRCSLSLKLDIVDPQHQVQKTSSLSYLPTESSRNMLPTPLGVFP